MSERQHILQNVFTQIKQRYNSLFFSKLILLQKEETENENVRHYDIECEAIISISAIINTKVQASQFKAFDKIKQKYRKSVYRRKKGYSEYGGTKSRNPQSKTSETYERHNATTSYIRRKPQNVQFSRISQQNGISDLRKKHLQNSPCSQADSACSDLNHSLNALVSRVRELEHRMQNKRENYEKKQLQYSRFSKRSQILQKLNRLEQDIADLLVDQQPFRKKQQQRHSFIHQINRQLELDSKKPKKSKTYSMKYPDGGLLRRRD